MNRLLEIGFEPAGHWLLKGDELAFELFRHASQRNILYAFVSDGEVKYVGKTVRSLCARMAGYKNPGGSQLTNKANHTRIKALLLSGAAVDILALPDNGLLHYGKFHFNLAAGLEDSIISILAPEWNGNTAIQEQEKKASELQSLPEQATQPVASFPLVVQKTYYNTGFFNVAVSYSAQLGNDGQEIEIFCGNAEQPILGTINRTANSNQTPRILGGKGLRDWFQREALEMQVVTVFVLTPTAIRLERSNA